MRGDATRAIVLHLGILGLLVLVGACGPQPEASPARIEAIAFRSGDFALAGDLWLPAGSGPFPVLLVVHGSGPADRTEGGSLVPVFELMQRVGYAVFAWDKPGSGQSTGRLDDNHLIEQRAQILLDAIEVMKARPDIDPEKIGLAGGSQAGYVMPRALALSRDIAFMVCVSCPGMAGVDQTTYLAMEQRICDGVPETNAERLPALLAELDEARTYETYDGYLRYRAAVRALTAIGHPSRRGTAFGTVPEAAWEKNDPAIEPWWNPMQAVRQAAIPILAFFAERDTQVDPVQGAHAYRKALTDAGNALSRVVLIPGANHGMVLAETGCMDEFAPGSRYTIAPEFLDALEGWLREVRR